jgi:hypothetical protein
MASPAGLLVANYVGTTNQTQIEHNGFCMTSTDNTYAALVVDDVEPALNDWVLLTAQTSAYQNGLYKVTRLANVANQVNWQMCRIGSAGHLQKDNLFYVTSGDTLSQTLWHLSSAVEDGNPVSQVTTGVSELTIEQVAVNPLPL